MVKMYTLQKVIENGEVHYEITKSERGREIFIESFDYNEYSQALKTLRNYNN